MLLLDGNQDVIAYGNSNITVAEFNARYPDSEYLAVTKISNEPDIDWLVKMPSEQCRPGNTGYHTLDNGDGSYVSNWVVTEDLRGSKTLACAAINEKTDELILGGFLHPTDSTFRFGLKAHDQRNMQGYFTLVVAGQDQTGSFFRGDRLINGAWVQENIIWSSNDEIVACFTKGAAMISVCTLTGATVKDAIIAATTLAGIDAVVDDRSWRQMEDAAQAQVTP